MTVNTLDGAFGGGKSRGGAWLLPLAPIAISIFAISALVSYHLRADAITPRTMAQSVVIGRVQPGEEIELLREVKDAVADGRPVFISAESSGRVQWIEGLSIMGRGAGSFVVAARVKNTGEREAVLTAHYRIG